MTGNTDEFAAAIASISDDPCAECGRPLGDHWTTRYNSEADRQERVHDAC